MDFKKELLYYKKLINTELKVFFLKVKKDIFSDYVNDEIINEGIRAIKNFCLSDGKRLRPILAIKTYQAITKKDPKCILKESIALELFHNYTLIHDDIYDEDMFRRGKVTCYAYFRKWYLNKYKNNLLKTDSSVIYKDYSYRFASVIAFIWGKILYGLTIFPIINSDLDYKKKNEIINLLFNLSLQDNIGQAKDLFFEKERLISYNDYFKMVNCKTVTLFKSCILLGLILSEANKMQCEALINYIQNVGEAFQIKDDLLDIEIDKYTRKRSGMDIRKGKMTILIIHALRNSNVRQKKIIFNVLGNQNISDEDIDKITDLFYKLGSIKYCENQAKTRIKYALLALRKISNTLDKDSFDFFHKFAHFVLKREY